MQEQNIESIVKKVLASMQDTQASNINTAAASQEEELGEVPVGISARHVHLSREHVEQLFGKGHQLTPKKELMGGQYAANECVTLVGTKLRAIENVRVLGPERKESQVEVSKTDCIRLGLQAPVRLSGDLEGSAPVAMVGPKGAVYLDKGCIVAKRHIHMSPADAQAFGVADKEVVDVRFGSSRSGILEGVQIRVDETFTLEMHIDTDEANGLGIGRESGTVIRRKG